jgi:hypothetical protein
MMTPSVLPAPDQRYEIVRIRKARRKRNEKDRNPGSQARPCREVNQAPNARAAGTMYSRSFK